MNTAIIDVLSRLEALRAELGMCVEAVRALLPDADSSGGGALAALLEKRRRAPNLLARQDEVRRRAVSLMKGFRRETNCTWTEAEDAVLRELWHEFEAAGLKPSKANIHQLRYSAKFADAVCEV